jgi:hypothetical protein
VLCKFYNALDFALGDCLQNKTMLCPKCDDRYRNKKHGRIETLPFSIQQEQCWTSGIDLKRSVSTAIWGAESPRFRRLLLVLGAHPSSCFPEALTAPLLKRCKLSSQHPVIGKRSPCKTVFMQPMCAHHPFDRASGRPLLQMTHSEGKLYFGSHTFV